VDKRERESTSVMLGDGAWWASVGMRHRVVLALFVAAVAVTMWRRALEWAWSGERRIDAEKLRETIVVVAIASPGEPVEPYLRLLETAKWPARVSLRMMKMLGPSESIGEGAERASRPGAKHGTVRIAQRYGGFDRAGARMAQARAAEGDAEYVLLLGQPVDAEAGWDEMLLRMLHQVEDGKGGGGGAERGRRPVSHFLTSALAPPAVGSSSAPGGFLCASGGGEGALRSRAFASPPSRPQPSLFATAQFCFGSAQSLSSAAPSKVRARSEDLSLSKALWMRGASFFAPQVGVMRSLSQIGHRSPSSSPPSSSSSRNPGSGGGEGDETHETGAPERGTVRTAREWAHFCGKRGDGGYGGDGGEKNRWSRRAQLGLTPHASHEERYSKHGDALAQHGL
jgi:hypothetical protein